VATTVSEKQAREVGEAKREATKKLPSFGKQLFSEEPGWRTVSPTPRGTGR
jgi:hypothetical protein